MPFTSLVVIAALIQYIIFTGLAGKSRGKYEIAAPAISGHETFERYFRVQQNTLEQLIIFFPSIFLFAYFVHDIAAAAIGIVFIIGRAIYMKAYITDPSTRGTGMITTFISSLILLLGGLIGIIVSFF